MLSRRKHSQRFDILVREEEQCLWPIQMEKVDMIDLRLDILQGPCDAVQKRHVAQRIPHVGVLLDLSNHKSINITAESMHSSK
ncbi:Hypothetical predicted protein [Octopus vulgaris]|uniref:Uncharacterized protein n=1 Tax=Octopus vulgaris TaxID=6645 RepID=A0AA36FH29_OCTVU|nr:Hypothetical predicted protein [Octopus vulgaris]